MSDYQELANKVYPPSNFQDGNVLYGEDLNTVENNIIEMEKRLRTEPFSVERLSGGVNNARISIDLLPTSLDDIMEFETWEALNATTEKAEGKLYVVKNTNAIYRWDIATEIFIEMSAGDIVRGEPIEEEDSYGYNNAISNSSAVKYFARTKDFEEQDPNWTGIDPNTIYLYNSDMLGGQPASAYVLKSELGDDDGSGQIEYVATDTQKLGGIVASAYALKNDLAPLSNNINTLTEQQVTLQTKASKHDTDIAALQDTIVALEAKNEELTTKVATLTNDNAALKSRLAEAEENITSLAAIVANCVQYSNMTEEQKTSLRTELDLVYLEEV